MNEDSDLALLLIVEDDLKQLELLQLGLLEHYECVGASSAKEALSLLAEKRKWEVVLCSNHLEENSTGVEILAEARKLCPDATRVLMSSELLNILEEKEKVGSGLIHGFMCKLWKKEDLFVSLAEARARKYLQESLVYKLLDSTPDPMVIIDSQGLIRRVNRRLENEFGWKREELIGKKVEILIPERFHEKHVELKDRYIKDPSDLEMGAGAKRFGLRKNGEEFPVELSLSILETPEERLVLGAIHNISERLMYETHANRNADLEHHNKELELARAKADSANHAKTYFLANMSHEIRTPLNAIIGFAQLMRGEEQRLSPQLQEYTRLIEEAGNLLTEVIGNILDLSKIEAGKFSIEESPLDLRALFKGIYHINKGRALNGGLDFNYHYDESLPPWIIGDRTLLNQVLMNLVSNAIKFSDAGKKVEMRATKKGSSFEVAIQDQGIGLTQAQIGKIFNPFEQADNSIRRRYGGTGLGLATSSSIVKQLGGEIRVESEMGVGSCFTLVLPLKEAEQNSEFARAKLMAFRKDLRVLVVEDNPINRKVILALLRGLKLEATYAESGQEALERIPDYQPDLVLLDLHMPEMDGFQVLKEIKNSPALAKITVFALTADAFKETRQRCIELGAQAFITKPIILDDLRNALSQHFPLQGAELEPELKDTCLSDNTKVEIKKLLERLENSSLIETEKIGDLLEELRAVPEISEPYVARCLNDIEQASLSGEKTRYGELLKSLNLKLGL